MTRELFRMGVRQGWLLHFDVFEEGCPYSGVGMRDNQVHLHLSFPQRIAHDWKLQAHLRCCMSSSGIPFLLVALLAFAALRSYCKEWMEIVVKHFQQRKFRGKFTNKSQKIDSLTQ